MGGLLTGTACDIAGLGSPWTCSAQQNANYENTGKKTYQSHWCREATGRVVLLGEGGGCAAPDTARSDTRSEGWVSTGTLPRAGGAAGRAALPLLPARRQDWASTRQVRAGTVCAVMPSESVEVFSRDLLICTLEPSESSGSQGGGRNAQSLLSID